MKISVHLFPVTYRLSNESKRQPAETLVNLAMQFGASKNNSVYFLAICETLGELSAEWYTILQEVNGISQGQGYLASHVSIENAESREVRDNDRAFQINGNKKGGNETPDLREAHCGFLITLKKAIPHVSDYLALPVTNGSSLCQHSMSLLFPSIHPSTCENEQLAVPP